MSTRYHALALAAAFVLGCGGPPPRPPADVAPPAEIRGVVWVLTTLKGSAVTPGARGAPTMQLGLGASSLTGFGGCNRLSGSYTLEGASLHIGPLVSTRMACPDALDLEAAFGATLAAVQGWRFAGADLELMAGDTVLATLRRQ